MSRDPLVDMRDVEDARANYLDGWRSKPADDPKPYSPAPNYRTFDTGECWCGKRQGHYWPGSTEGTPHPPSGTRTVRLIPPEVVVDHHGRQVLAKTEDGEPFRQYLLCSKGCGYLIGCGDAIDKIAHASCSRSVSRLANRETAQ